MMTSSTTIPGSNDSAANEVNTVETIQAEIVNNLEKIWHRSLSLDAEIYVICV